MVGERERRSGRVSKKSERERETGSKTRAVPVYSRLDTDL